MGRNTKDSIWRPSWWVFLPATLPCASLLWLRLGLWLHLNLVPPAGSAPPAANGPAWLLAGYYIIQRIFWIFLSPGAVLTLWILHGNMGAIPGWVFWAGILFSVTVECLFLYGMLVMIRWGKRHAEESP